MSSQAPELIREIVQAGAGTGKTYSLVNKVIEIYEKFLRDELRPPQIVVTTFTRKATQELKERLLQKACEREDSRLIEYMSDGLRLHISTIHGLLSLFLRQVSHLADIDPGFQVSEQEASQQILRQLFREELVANPEGLKWLEDYGFNLLLEMYRKWSQAFFENPYLQPASLEMLIELRNQEVQKTQEILHEVAARVLEEASEPKWNEYGLQMQQIAESWDGDAEVLFNLPRRPNITPKTEHLGELAEFVSEEIAGIKKTWEMPGWNPEAWPQMTRTWQEFHQLAAKLLARVDEHKRRSGQLDMADLETYSLQILRQMPYLAEPFSSQWDFWLIDEFQDTSPLQVKILDQLIGNSPVYYVGDPQQSIYLFRGARSEVFTERMQEIREQGGGVGSLKKNYRSDPKLLHFINDMIGDLGEGFQGMVPKSESESLQPLVAKVFRVKDEETERLKLAEEIIELVKQGASLEQICVLGRTHQELMNMATVLKASGLPTHVHSPSGFWSRREVKDLFAIWRFLVNPHDNQNLLVLLRTPYFLVMDLDLSQWMHSRPSSLWRKLNSMENVPESVERLKAAVKTAESHGLVSAFEDLLEGSGVLDLSLMNDPAGRKESNIWKFLNHVRELERESGHSFISLEPIETDEDSNVESDATSSQEPNAVNLMTIHGAKGLEFNHVVIPNMGARPNWTNKTTLRASDGHFSFAIRWGEDKDRINSPLDIRWVNERRQREKEESRRALYVALTRARHSLILSSSKIEKESWASDLSLFTQPSGVKETPNYSLEIADVNEAKETFFSRPQKETRIRPRWQFEEFKGDVHRQSVTKTISASEKILPPQALMHVARKKAEGVWIHRLLEAARYGHKDFAVNKEIQKALKFVMELKSPPMKELLQSGHAEWGFHIRTSKGMLEGQIDLWGKFDGKLWVVDYKSGTEQFKEQAFRQLSLYGWSLRQFGHHEPIHLAVIYPLSEKKEIREMGKDLFADWEHEFGLAERAGQDKL